MRRKLNDTFAAADLAQDTFVSVIHSDQASEIREPRPFLATIARRLIAHRHRRQRLEDAYLEVLATLPSVLPVQVRTRSRYWVLIEQAG